MQPFKGVDSAKVVYLEAEQVTRVINSCEPTVRRLVQAALLTGRRYGELAALRVGDVKA